eukprot:SAG31_NODE_38123_length_298_cov_2.437186_1_plen_41_part_10
MSTLLNYQISQRLHVIIKNTKTLTYSPKGRPGPVLIRAQSK